MIIWGREEWRARMQTHAARVDVQADAFMGRRSRGTKHPVHDFLFTYYSFAPSRLKQWVPPAGVSLECTAEDLAAYPWLQGDRFVHANGLLHLDTRRFTPREADFSGWVAMLCTRILGRAGRFSCYGMHEWAMVYRQSADEVRHQGYELRLPPDELAAFVNSLPVCCSHYDAYRFFTPEARPLNVLNPTLDTRPDFEQGACLHANMDLYKWSSKLWPWTGSDLIGECFELAMRGRDLDMRASPYELTALGYEALKVETPEGRAQYEREQRALSLQAAELRRRLQSVCLTLSELPVAHASAHLLAQADEGALRQVQRAVLQG